MPKKYRNIFFDLDHTLWDFEKNSNDTLNELIIKYELHQLENFDLDTFLRRFHASNFELWDRFNKNQITLEELRGLRFDGAFAEFLPDVLHLKQNFNDEYLEICPYKGNLVAHAKELLEHLYANYYNLYILTNGLEHIQLIKLTTSNIFHFFENVFTPKDIGHKKPHAAYFTSVLDYLQVHASDCIMVGDSLEVDVIPAMNVGIDGVWFNPKRLEVLRQKPPTYEVYGLLDFIKIID